MPVITGDDNDNMLIGGGGDDTLEGLGGNDNLEGMTGNDFLDGGDGEFDYVVYSNAVGGGVTVDLSNAGPQAVGGAQGTDTILNVEGVIGSNFADTLTGNGGQNHFTGDGGNDRIDGGGGMDWANYWNATGALNIDLRIQGVAQNVGGGQGADTLISIEGVGGGNFNDVITGDDADNQLDGGGGNDTLSGNGGYDGLHGGAGDDRLIGGDDGAQDSANYHGATSGVTVNLGIQGVGQFVGGGHGTDTFVGIESAFGSSHNDVIIGNDGDNNLSGQLGDDHLDGRGGQDSVDYWGAPAGVAVDLNLQGMAQDTGGAGVDTLFNFENILGSHHADTLTGDAGNNFFVVRTGNDVIDGRDGWDSVGYHEEASAVIVDLALSGPNTSGGSGEDTLINIEGVNGTVFNDTLLGNDQNNGFTGDQGDDYIDGRGGVDAVSFWQATTGVTVDLSRTDAQEVGGGNAGFDTIINVENVDGTQFADTISGNAESNFVGGREGDDLISGRDGDDYLVGDQGADTLQGDGGGDGLSGREGNDLLDGGDGDDRADYSLPAGTTGTLRVIDGVGADAGKQIVQRVDGAVVEDILAVTRTAPGEFTVEGRGSLASVGVDTLRNVEHVNVFVENPNGPPPASTSVQLTVQAWTYPPNQHAGVNGTDFDDTIDMGAYNQDVDPSWMRFGYGRGGDDLLIGGHGAENLNGERGSDTLMGHTGDDNLNGGEGNDTLDGGIGRDIASFELPADFTGQLRLVAGAQPETVVLQRVDGAVVEDLFLIARTSGGSVTVEGVGAMTGQGTDTLQGMEGLSFYVPNQPIGMFVPLTLNAWVYEPNHHVGVDGTPFNDVIDLADFHQDKDASWQRFVNAGEGQDHVTGTEGNDGLNGQGGADTLVGSGGNDNLDGGQGDDRLEGGAGFDTATYNSATGGVSVSLSVAGPQNVGGGQGIDTLIGIENLSGGQFGDTLVGDATGNFINGQQGNDSIAGGAGNDNLIGSFGDDVIAGNEDHDSLQGAIGNDTLLGGMGSDQLHGQNGDDYLDGGLNVDVALYTTASSGVTVDLAIAGYQAVGGGMGSDQLVSIEQLVGSNHADTLSGDAGGNFLGGGAGDDSLNGRDGNDTLRGGAGNDVIDGGGSAPVLGVRGAVGGDIASYLGEGTAGVTADLAIAGAQAVGGGLGLDTLVNIENLSGTNFSDTLSGDAGSNYLGGNDGDDSLFGRDGDDVLEAHFGNDLLDGGAGIDWAAFTTANGGVTVDLRVATAQAVGGGLGQDVLASIENLFGSQFADRLTGTDGANEVDASSGDDTVTGLGGADDLMGSAGNDSLSGGEGDDTLAGEAHFDFIDGGAGADVATFSGVRADYQITVQPNGFVVVTDLRPGGPDGSDTLTGVETLQFADVAVPAMAGDNLTGTEGDDFYGGSPGNDTYSGLGGSDGINGAQGDDRLLGGAGEDFLRGNAGNDTLEGDADADYLVGGPGDDRLDGGEGWDRASYFRDTGGGVSVDLRLTTAQDTGFGVDTLVNIEHVSGTPFSDTLTGTDDANWLWGSGGGADLLNGNGGDDLLMVGRGDHVLNGGAGRDAVALPIPQDVTGGVTLSLALQGQVQDTGQGMMLLTGIEDLSGTVYDDALTGDGGANVLAGNEGNDQLNGGGGDDVLYGDGLIDIFSNAGGSGTIHTYADAAELGGAPGADTLTGGTGNDVLHGGSGNDSLSGGDGQDRALFSGAQSDYQVQDLGGGIFSVTDLRAGSPDGTDTLSGVEVLGFSSGDYTLPTAPPPGVIKHGGNGADTVEGTGGADELYGDNGSDKVIAGAGADKLFGGNGSDTLQGDGGNDSLSGGNGGDILTGGTGDDLLTGDNGGDIFVFGAGFGHDRITDFDNADQIRFQAGTFTNFNDVKSHAQQVGDDVVITDNAGNVLTLLDVSLMSLNSGDFIFG